MLQEVTERQRIKNNVILFDMERQNGLSKDDSLNAEKEDDLKILTHLPPQISVGWQVNFKPEPVKVCLSNPEHAFNLLKKSSKLKENEDCQNISMDFDQAPRQFLYYKRVKKRAGLSISTESQ